MVRFPYQPWRVLCLRPSYTPYYNIRNLIYAAHTTERLQRVSTTTFLSRSNVQFGIVYIVTTKSIYKKCDPLAPQTKSVLPPMYWGGIKNSRDRYLKTLAKKTVTILMATHNLSEKICF